MVLVKIAPALKSKGRREGIKEAEGGRRRYVGVSDDSRGTEREM